MDNKEVRISLTLDKDNAWMKEALKRFAKAEKRSLNTYCLMVLEKHLRRRLPKDSEYSE